MDDVEVVITLRLLRHTLPSLTANAEGLAGVYGD